MHFIEPYWNDSRVVGFRNSDAYPYARGLAVISGIALAVSAIAFILFAAAPFLLSVAEATIVISEWAIFAASFVAAGYFIKGYLEKFYELVQAKIASILKAK